MTLLVLRPEHPAADLHDALDEPLWEGLAAAAVENALVAATEPVVEGRLIKLGLLFPSGLPTAAGCQWRLHSPQIGRLKIPQFGVAACS